MRGRQFPSGTTVANRLAFRRFPAMTCYIAATMRNYKVGDRVKVNLHTGRIVDATIKAVIERTDGKRLQVDFGKDETALVHLWHVVKRVR